MYFFSLKGCVHCTVQIQFLLFIFTIACVAAGPRVIYTADKRFRVSAMQAILNMTLENFNVVYFRIVVLQPRALTICTEISVKNFGQIVLV